MKLRKHVLWPVSAALVVVFASPAHAVVGTNYYVSQYYGHISGAVAFTGATTFKADIDVWNSANCGGYATVGMFKIYYKDGTTDFTRQFDNPLWCSTGPVQYSNESFDPAGDKKIIRVTARICTRVGGQATSCQLDSTTIDNLYT